MAAAMKASVSLRLLSVSRSCPLNCSHNTSAAASRLTVHLSYTRVAAQDDDPKQGGSSPATGRQRSCRMQGIINTSGSPWS
jgi:hypothetical protein